MADAQTPAPTDEQARYRFLLGFLIERGVLTDKRYGNGTWCLRGGHGLRPADHSAGQRRCRVSKGSERIKVRRNYPESPDSCRSTTTGRAEVTTLSKRARERPDKRAPLPDEPPQPRDPGLCFFQQGR